MTRNDRTRGTDRRPATTEPRAGGRHRTVRGTGSGALRIAPVFWMTILALFIVTVGVLPAAGDPVPSRPAASIAVRVSAADTLWSIAAAHRLPGVTTTQMVRLIEDTNSLSGPVLCAGAVLLVPAETTADPTYAQVTAPERTE